MSLQTGGNINVAGNGNVVDLNVVGPANFTSEVYVAGNLVVGANLKVVNVNEYVGATGNVSFVGNLIPGTDGNTYTLGLPGIPWSNIYADYLHGDGSQLTNLPAGNYSNANVISLLSSGTVSSNIRTTANISGSYLLGNGAFITGLPAGYSNTEVQTYLASNANVVITTTGDVTTTANVSGAYILGNISLATGAYSNTNAQSYLASNANITINTTGAIRSAGNITASYFIGNGSQLTGLYSNTTAAAYLNTFTGTLGGSGMTKVTLGNRAGSNAQGTNTVAVGNSSGQFTQGNSAVAMGWNAGQLNQVANSVAIGAFAGQLDQNGIAIGTGAGQSYQSGGIAIGANAAGASQGTNSIAIGNTAGSALQGNSSIAIGLESATTSQGNNSVAIGTLAGNSNQGDYAVAIGYSAGLTNQAASSIIINGGNSGLNATNPGLYVNPVRVNNTNTTTGLYYNPSTKEITYANVLAYGNANVSSYLDGVFTSDIIPNGNATQSLGNATHQFKDLWVSNSTIYIDNIPLSANGNGELMWNGNAIIIAEPSGDLGVSTNLYVTGTSYLHNTGVNGSLGVSSIINAGGNITGANIISNANVQGTVITSFQPYITVIGNLEALTANAISANSIALTGNATVGGDLYVTGNINIPGNINQISGNSGQFFGNALTGFDALYAGIPVGYTLLPQEVMHYASNLDGYTQVGFQNMNSGSQATADFVAVADNGTDTTNYIDMGIASSAFNGVVAGNNNAMGTAVYPNDGYLYATGDVNGGNLVIASNQANGVVRIAAGGGNLTNVGVTIRTPQNSTSSITGTMSINGGLGVTGPSVFASSVYADTFIGDIAAGNVTISGNIVSTGNVTLNNVTANVLTGANIADTVGLANVAYSGEYSALLNAPTLLSDFTNDTDYQTVANANVISVNGQTGEVSLFIPLTTSELVNDSGFITRAVANVQSINGQSGIVILDIPTETSQLNNDAGFITDATANVISVNGQSGVVVLGNVSDINLNGNASTVLAGDGTWVAQSGGNASTGNVTFDDNIVIGTGDGYGGAGLYLAVGTSTVADGQLLRLRGGDVPSHIHLDTGNNEFYDQYFGDDGKYLKLSAGATGNIVIGTNALAWTFDDNGNLTLPGNIKTTTTGFSFTSNVSGVDTTSIPGAVIVTLVDSEFGGPETGQVTITGVIGTTEANGTWYYEAVEVDQIQLYYDADLNFPVDGTGWPAYDSGGLAVAQGYDDLTITGGNVSITNNSGNTWTFDSAGNLTTPGNTVISSIPGGGGAIVQHDTPLQVLGAGANSFMLTGWAESDTGPGNVAVIGFNSPIAVNGQANVAIVTGNIGGTQHEWSFGNDGNLTLPSNTFSVNYANGSPVTLNTYGDSNVISLLSNIGSNSITTTGNITAGNFIGNGSQLTGIVAQTTGSWTLSPGVNTVSFTAPSGNSYAMWVNGNIPNGIVVWNATVTITNTNVPVIGTQYAWYYLAGNALVLNSIPSQIVGTSGTISTATASGTTNNVFEFSITNNSGSTQTVNWGFSRL